MMRPYKDWACRVAWWGDCASNGSDRGGISGLVHRHPVAGEIQSHSGL